MFKQSLALIAICALLISFVSAADVTGAPVEMGNDPSLAPIVKIWNSWDFKGSVFDYNSTDGYVQLPNEFFNKAESFQTGIDVCFIKFHPREQYQMRAGDFHRNYAASSNFGGRMDGLYAGSCTESICPLK
ncbi:hypothetical protein CYY_001789 [Polysphondylium violaceum]|uniref:Uncharacterized protein n=1 Tax=Polysphondylium violaceum TaxID=133409 RepID=A0A8J4Q2E3_9MYCE|nr:hypothetical protein CYY_001789 [Polysphondylium violaceum]